APVTSDELSSSDDRQIVSGGGSVIQIFGDDDTPATITPTTTPTNVDDGAIGGAGDGVAGPPASTSATSQPIVPVVPSTNAPTTSDAARTTPSSSSTTKAPIAVQSIQVSSTKLDFGSNGTAVKVALFNPNSFPITFSTAVSSSMFAASPSTGTLAAGEQSSMAITFDRARAAADPKNFPTGSFSHTLTFTTSASGGSSSPTRTATMFGAIERTTTTSAPISISVNKVSGTSLQCSTLGIRAIVTTNGKVASGSVFGGAQFKNADGELLGPSPTLTMSLGIDDYWRATTSIPKGTTTVLIEVTAETTTGQSAIGSATLATTC
ncbi:MAG: hypothetical protein O3B06_10885, partial [Actinobacteria bacterium]|nr:hypothetical protein [Actinomycetota bacterium]